MVLLESKKEGFKILSDNSFEKVSDIITDLTEVYEDNGIFLVNEYKNSEKIVKEFATKNKGYYSSLIICLQ